MTQRTISPSRRVITRREALGGCLVAAVACGLPFEGFAGTRDAATGSARSGRRADMRRRADLYVFGAQEPEKTVVTLVWAQDPTGRFRQGSPAKTETRLHIGGRTWSSHGPSSGIHDLMAENEGVRFFSGPVVEGAGASTVILEALLVEGPSAQLAGQGIWAERLGSNGSRHRVGSPFLAALVDEDESLAALYDASSPATDTRMLSESVARAISKRAGQAGYSGDPDLHGRRLAALLLPDTVKYDPRLPAGFTFAACNGRHPAEPDSTIVNSILNGFPDGEGPARRSPTLHSSFPYFQPHAAIA
jgi:hypothetical protein